MKLGRLNHFGLVTLAAAFLLAVPVAAQTADQWERGTDPATGSPGLKHSASGVFLTCMGQGAGLVHVTAPDVAPSALKVQSGTLSAQLIEPGMLQGRAHVFVSANDPALLAGSVGPLRVAGHDLGFSERDRRYIGLFLRMCKASD